MSSRSRRLYVGITGDLTRRVDQHRRGEIDGFTKKYQMVRLVYVEATSGVRAAIRREKQIKGWTRAKKVALIESLNPRWRDFGNDLFGKILRFAQDDISSPTAPVSEPAPRRAKGSG